MQMPARRGGGHMGVTWNMTATASPSRWFRGAGAGSMLAVLSTVLVATGTGVVVQRTIDGPAPVGVGASPWFGTPELGGGLLALPDLGAVEQVVNVGPAWLAGATGH